MKKLLIILVFVPFLFGAHGYPGAVFLMIWPAARPTSLGGAFSAIADDPSATYYNPSGLGFLKERFNATLMHCNWLPGLTEGLDISMYYDFLALTYKTQDIGTFGFNTIYLNTGETEVWNEKGELLGKYTTFDVALTFAYGYPILKNLSLGLSWKFIYSFLVPDWVWKAMPELGVERGGTGITWAFDFGLLYKPLNWLSLGTSLANIGPPISYIAGSEPDPLPRMLRVGINFSPIKNEMINLNLPLELNIGLVEKADTTTSELEDMWKSFGIELNLANNLFSLRLGYFEDVTGWRGGVIVEDENGEQDCISIFEYLFNRKGRKLIKGDRKIAIPFTWGIGFAYKNFSLDISSDELIYSFETTNYKFSFNFRM